MQHLSIGKYPTNRMRRRRQSAFSRQLMAECTLHSQDLILPVFVHTENAQKPIQGMPGQFRHSLESLCQVAQQCETAGIPAIMLFPVITDDEKDLSAQAAYHPEGLIPQAIRAIKAVTPKLGVLTDVALDPYTSHGQDGIINDAGDILNEATIEVLIKQALCHAAAGADMVCPSDMMDGRIGEIRAALEAAGFSNTQILAYAAKYASHFYGPFREAVGSQGALGKADKSTYQLDYRNRDEALHEVALDIEEGADFVMVKPGLPYLDILYRVKTAFGVPTMAYQVSGEYTMLKMAAKAGIMDEQASVMETLLAFKRAGADAIITYYALEAAQWCARSK